MQKLKLTTFFSLAVAVCLLGNIHNRAFSAATANAPGVFVVTVPHGIHCGPFPPFPPFPQFPPNFPFPPNWPPHGGPVPPIDISKWVELYKDFLAHHCPNHLCQNPSSPFPPRFPFNNLSTSTFRSVTQEVRPVSNTTVPAVRYFVNELHF